MSLFLKLFLINKLILFVFSSCYDLAGNENGLLQALNLNVYRLMANSLTMPINLTINTKRRASLTNEIDAINSTINKLTNKTSNFLLLSNHVTSMHPTQAKKKIIQHNQHFIKQFNHLSTHLDANRMSSVVDLIVNQTFTINKSATNQYIQFNRFNLSTLHHYLFIIFASNSLGQSEQIEFEWIANSGAYI